MTSSPPLMPRHWTRGARSTAPLRASCWTSAPRTGRLRHLLVTPGTDKHRMTNADFLKSALPEPVELADFDPNGPGRFFNRELSWLGFNWRVLEEAANPRVPLLERLRFLSISATNLDEFYTVRVAGLRELAHAGNTTPAADGLTPAEQLVLIDERARRLMAEQQRVLTELRELMGANGISIVARED